MNWEPGELPTGWVRGAALRVTNAYYVCGARVALEPELPILYADVFATVLEFVTFHHAERARVIAWLRWYFDVKPDEPLGFDFLYVFRAIR